METRKTQTGKEGGYGPRTGRWRVDRCYPSRSGTRRRPDLPLLKHGQAMQSSTLLLIPNKVPFAPPQPDNRNANEQSLTKYNAVIPFQHEDGDIHT
jgi:hypothetical protein